MSPYMVVLDSFLLELAVTTLLCTLFLRYLPDITMKWKDIWLGALLTAALFGATFTFERARLVSQVSNDK